MSNLVNKLDPKATQVMSMTQDFYVYMQEIQRHHDATIGLVMDAAILTIASVAAMAGASQQEVEAALLANVAAAFESVTMQKETKEKGAN